VVAFVYQNPPRAARPHPSQDEEERVGEFHNAMLGARVRVGAQFGPDSDEFASLGMKKKSAYRATSCVLKTPVT
jgi:hypothetical protein